MKAYWEKLECSETPKAHLLFTHAVPQMVRLNGIGDKPDDILEIEHQFYNKMEVALTRVGNVSNRMRLLVKRKWMLDDPQVDQCIKQIYKKVETRVTLDAVTRKANSIIIKQNRKRRRKYKVDQILC